MSNEIDALLGRVEDPSLRDDLTKQFNLLRRKRQFGLVFEEHLPEFVVLPQHPIHRGTKVTRKGEVQVNPMLVMEVARDSVEVLTDNGGIERIKNSDVVAVAEYGDPVYMGLGRLGEVERDPSKPFHTVIKGENHHALEALQFTHAGKIDCIYIDPPYNSGARDWKYNNDYVDKNDAYRNSRWLSFMDRRLRLARQLLNPADSVLIVAIDENEVHRLSLLLEQIFPSSKIQMVTVLINPAGASIIDQFDRVDEHLLFVHIGDARPARTIAETTPLGRQEEESSKPKPIRWTSLQRSGGNSLRSATKAKFFAVFIDEEGERVVGCSDHLPEGVSRSEAPSPPEGCIAQWPINQAGVEVCWQVSAPRFREYLAAGRIRVTQRNAAGRYGLSFLTKGHMRDIESGELVITGHNKDGSLNVEPAEGRLRTRDGKTMWTHGAYSAREHGARLLRNVVPGRKFPFPKSLYAVEDALRFYLAGKPNAIVLDFFAGSGTTAHAVFRLNQQDGGRRQSILVTNNEVSEEEAKDLKTKGFSPGDPEWEALGIFDFITRPRLSAAIEGVTPEGDPIEGSYRFVDEVPMSWGFKENIRFLELTYLNSGAIELDMAFGDIAPLLWLRSGSSGSMITDSVDESGEPLPFEIAENYAVLFDVDSWRSFLEQLPDAVNTVFIVTASATEFSGVAKELPPGVDVVRLYDTLLVACGLSDRATGQ